jgi:hypothetical protein
LVDDLANFFRTYSSTDFVGFRFKLLMKIVWIYVFLFLAFLACLIWLHNLSYVKWYYSNTCYILIAW